MKKKSAKMMRQLSPRDIWQNLTEEVRQDLIEKEKITNADELAQVMEDLRSSGIADVSQLLVAAGRDQKVKVLNFSHGDGEQEESGYLDHLHLKGTTPPFLMIKLGERHKAVYSFLYSTGKIINKIVRVVDEANNILYEN